MGSPEIDAMQSVRVLRHQADSMAMWLCVAIVRAEHEEEVRSALDNAQTIDLAARAQAHDAKDKVQKVADLLGTTDQRTVVVLEPLRATLIVLDHLASAIAALDKSQAKASTSTETVN